MFIRRFGRVNRWAAVPAVGIAVTLASLGASPVVASATTAAPTVAAPVALQTAKFIGVGTLSGPGPSTFADGLNDATPGAQVKPSQLRRSAPVTGSPAVGIPDPTGRTVSTRARATGFDGLDHRDQRLAGTGPYVNTQFSLEPPDQGLCVGGGFVLEAVNTAFRVFDTSGHALTAPVAYNQFFGLAPEVIRPAGPFGDFVSDPKCNFDPATSRWFMTVLQADAPGLCLVGPFNSAVPCSRAHTLIAVSQSADPTGGWNAFSIDATDDGTQGTPDHSNATVACPCFGDQPLLGVNADSVIISTNEYGAALPGIVAPANPEIGGQVYAISKLGLENAASNLTVAHINVGALAMPANDCCVPWDSLQPATSPSATSQPAGVEYFLSSFTNHNGVSSAINAWSLTGTDTLTSATPSLHLQRAEVPSEAYSYDQPFGLPGVGGIVATQKDGPRPLADALIQGGLDPGALPLLNANDVRMNQVVYADGHLWSGVNTNLVSHDQNVQRSGIAYFVVTPILTNGTLSASMFAQDYVAVDGNSTMFPSIAVNDHGIGAMAFSLVGPDYYPSSAYILMRPTGHSAGNVVIAGAGAAPADGFTGYPAETGTTSTVERWGDYSAAVIGPDGSAWLASEYITPRPRTVLANWGTFVYHVGA